MKRHLLTMALLSLCVTTTLAQQRDGPERPHSSTSESTHPDDPYAVLVERNMFLRDRPRPRATSTQPSSSTQPADAMPDTPERRFVLRGVAIENDEWRAYFENIRTGEGLRVRPGDPIGSGHIAQIDIDAVAYAGTDGTMTWIDVGQNLNGIRDTHSAPSSAGPTTRSASSATGVAGPTSAPTDPALLSIEERMRQRNQRQRGGNSSGR